MVHRGTHQGVGDHKYLAVTEQTLPFAYYFTDEEFFRKYQNIPSGPGSWRASSRICIPERGS